MGRKKIAVFATGWASDILFHFMEGMRDELKNYDADMYLFLCYATYGETENNRHGELNIFKLPDISKFDGVVIITNLIDFPGVAEDIVERCRKAGVPVLSHGRILEGIPSIVTDNMAGSRVLTEHLIKEHGVKRIVFLAGAADNSDSNDRLRAVKEVLEKNGLSLPDKDIVYTNWDLSISQSAAKERVKANGLPDAFVCANDEIAMVITIALDEIGIKCPQDVLITGFDHITESQVFYPTIASVDQNSYEHGGVCASGIVDLMEGKHVDELIQIPCKFIPAESCGCQSSQKILDQRIRSGTISFKKNQLSSFATWHTLHLERIIMDCESYNDIKHAITEDISGDHSFEGDNFHILFDPTAYRSEIVTGVSVTDTDSYSGKQDVIFSIRNGKVQNIRSVRTDNLIPGLSEDDDKHLYVFLPLHERELRIGYLVFCDCYDRIESKAIREYGERFNSAIEKARKGMYLRAINDSIRELSHVDALTHVKNRTAYESRLEEIRKRAERKGALDFGIILFDVNNLKKINDQLGHYAGDEYIKNSCSLICVAFKNSPVYRIGGDEFVVLLEGKAFEQRDEQLRNFVEEMNDLINDDSLAPEERVSVAYGMSIYKGAPETIDDCIKRADETMYETKMKMKGSVR
jgi:diguanylate cyclase (GGDEF)-like protein